MRNESFKQKHLKRVELRKMQPKYRKDGSLIKTLPKEAARKKMLREISSIINTQLARKYRPDFVTAEQEAIQNIKPEPIDVIIKPKRPRVLHYEGEQSHSPKFTQGGLPSLGKRR